MRREQQTRPGMRVVRVRRPGPPVSQATRTEGIDLDGARRAVEIAALELAARANALREVTTQVRAGESSRAGVREGICAYDAAAERARRAQEQMRRLRSVQRARSAQTQQAGGRPRVNSGDRYGPGTATRESGVRAGVPAAPLPERTAAMGPAMG